MTLWRTVLALVVLGLLAPPDVSAKIPYDRRISTASTDLDRAVEDFVCKPPEDEDSSAVEDDLFDENELPDIITRRDEEAAEGKTEETGDGSAPAETSELDAWRSAVERFEARSLEFAEEVNRVIGRKYEEEIRELRGGYDTLIDRSNQEERLLRDLAIESLEAFVKDHPDSPYTARRMVRLAELYYEESKEQYFAANDEYSELSDAFDRGEVEFLPEPPEKDLRRSIALYKRIIRKFPDFEDLGVVYYMLGFCYSDEQSRHLDVERAEATYLDLLENVDRSSYRAQAYFRLGEIYFEENRLDEALSYYRSIVEELEAEGIDEDPDKQRLYELSLYKLAWAYYKIDDLPVAIARFKSLLDWAERKEARTGKEADLKPETIRYLAIALSDLAMEYGILPIDFARQQLEDRQTSSWAFPVYVELASILKDQARFEEAIGAYAYLQEANPNHPMGPEYMWQIIGLNQALVIPDQDAADAARIALTNLYGRDSAWMQANKNNKEAIKLARNYILQSLQFVAFGYHSRAQESADPQDYRLAAEKYVEYLEQYPFAPNAYELSYYLAECYFFIGAEPVRPSDGLDGQIGWEKAIEVYGSLFNFPEDDFRKEAIVNIMYAYNFLWKYRGGSEIQEMPESLAKLDPPLGEKVQYSRVEITDLEKNYIRAVRWVQREVSESEDIPAVLYDVAQIYFYKNHLERARSVLMFLIENHPKTDFAAFAAGDIINSYRWTGDLARMRDFGERFAMLDLGEDPEIAETRNAEVKMLAKQSLAKDGEVAYAFERYECALLSFLEYYKLYGTDATTEEPSKIDIIVYNIAQSFSKLGKAADSDRYYRVLLADFPESERAPNTFWKMAQNAEQVFDLEEAVKYYLELRRYHPTHKDVPNALLNAGFLAVGLQDYGRAAERYEQYHDEYAEDEKSPDYLFRAAELWESNGNRRKAKRLYERWLSLYGDTNADTWVETQWKLANFAREAKRAREADRRVALIDESYEAIRPQLVPGGPGGAIAAEIRFQSHIDAYDEYAEFRITNIEDPEVGQQQIDRKAEWHSEIIKMMDDFTIAYSDFEWQTAALYYRAMSFQNHADTWLSSPNPYDPDSDEEFELFDKYQEVLERRVQELGLEDAAIAAFKLVVEQAKSKKRYTPWVDKALRELNRVDPNTFPVPKPEKSTVIPADSMELPPVIEKLPGLSQRAADAPGIRFAERGAE